MQHEPDEALQQAVRSLSPPFNEILTMMYLEGKTLAEVAQELGLSPQRVQYLHSRGLRILHRHFRPLP